MKNNSPIYLCGFMGCGKTTVGLLLSKKTGKQYIDLDDYIEEKEGMKIPEIFEKKGENYFREQETNALKELESVNSVVATGGGALLSDINGEIAKNAGTVIFIDVPFDLCYNRIKGDKNRPIAYNSTREQLQERFDYRRPLYIKNSHFSVDGVGTPEAVTDRIIKNIEEN